MATVTCAVPVIAYRRATKASTPAVRAAVSRASANRVVAVNCDRSTAAITPTWPTFSGRACRTGRGARSLVHALTKKKILSDTGKNGCSEPDPGSEPQSAGSSAHLGAHSPEGRVKPPPESAAFAACAALSFAVIAFDVNSPMSLHLLQTPDLAVHSFVSAHTSFEFRKYIADILISDVWLAASVVGWFVAGSRLFHHSPKAALRRLGVGLGLYMVAGGGVSAYKDPLLVRALKDSFHRLRPTDDLHHSFSFPSGHSNGAVFITGFLLFVLLMPVTETSPSGEEKARLLAPRVATATLVSIWVAAGLTTASGRVLADVHWLSDTMAGASLGALLVSLGALAVGQMEKVPMLPREADEEDTSEG